MSNSGWSKFFWRNWRTDPGLRLCSIAARGLWMEILAMAHEGEPYGHLTIIAGKAPTPEQIAVLAGCNANEVAGLLKELEDNGVFSRTPDGVIFSRRMVRDAAYLMRQSKNGKLGGNPELLKAGSGKSKSLKRGVKVLEERRKKKEERLREERIRFIKRAV